MTNKLATRVLPRAVPKTINVAEAKRHFSELLGRVAIGHETLLITRRGRPMARLAPVQAEPERSRLGHALGWLDDDDPFFTAIEEIVEERGQHLPRVLHAKAPRGGGRRPG